MSLVTQKHGNPRLVGTVPQSTECGIQEAKLPPANPQYIFCILSLTMRVCLLLQPGQPEPSSGRAEHMAAPCS